MQLPDLHKQCRELAHLTHNDAENRYEHAVNLLSAIDALAAFKAEHSGASATMQLPEMPSLPEGETRTDYHIDGRGEEAFTADQMRAYAEEYALLVLSSASAWQPIETAPKDGTRIIVYRTGYAEAGCIGFWSNDYDEWRIAGAGNCFLNATHWAPLPQPPKEQ
jgi:hypothetical protein